MHAHDDGATPGLAAPDAAPSTRPADVARMGSGFAAAPSVDPTEDAPAGKSGKGVGGLSEAVNDVSAALAADRARKDKATTMAEAAMAGVSVHELADGSFLASRWGLLKPCADLAAVRHLVQRVRGAS